MLETGTLRMRVNCKENNYPLPVWKTNGDNLELTFMEIGHRLRHDGVSDGVKEALILIVKLLVNSEGIKADDIVKEIGKSKPTIERYLRTAKDLKMLESTGSPKTGGYYLTNKMMAIIKD